MVLAVLAQRPNVTQGKLPKKNVKQRKVKTWLFFGKIFNKMKLEDYKWAN